MDADRGRAPRDDPDFATLASGDEYARYFTLLHTVFERLLAAHRMQAAGESYETGVVPGYLQRLLYTVEVLRLRCTYSPADERRLWVDLTDSGFPNSMEVGELGQDLLQREDRLRQLPVTAALKRAALDRLLQENEEPTQLLVQLSERTYFEMLDATKLLLPFAPGTLTRRSENEKHRGYVFSWACYDFQTNRPYVHVMTFDQDARQEALEEGGPAYAEFLDAIRAEGSRAPDVGILALALDDRIESVHPKIVKRLCIGPLFAPMLVDKCPTDPADQRLHALRGLVARHCRHEHDALLFFTDEIVFSKAQTVTRSLLSPRGKVREIFAITETDPECYARRASVVHHNVLLPHGLLQHVGPEAEAAVSELVRCRKITYDDEGTLVIHG